MALGRHGRDDPSHSGPELFANRRVLCFTRAIVGAERKTTDHVQSAEVCDRPVVYMSRRDLINSSPFHFHERVYVKSHLAKPPTIWRLAVPSFPFHDPWD